MCDLKYVDKKTHILYLSIACLKVDELVITW